MPHGVPRDHLLRTKRTERALRASLTAQIGRERKGEREKEDVTGVLIIFHGLHDRVHAPEVTRAVARVMVSPRNKRGTRGRNRGRNKT